MNGSDFLQLDIEDAPPGGRADWLTRQLREAISDGRLPVGSRLPASRVLAAELRVSRGVVTEAYRRLTEDGQVVGLRRAGTVVVAAPVTGPRTKSPGSATAPRTRPVPEPGMDIFDSLRATPARIDLSPGRPDLGAFPRTAWLRAERAVLGGLSPTDFGYGDPHGAAPLRRAVASWLARNRGIRADPDEVIIISGVAQALALLAQVLPRHGISEIAIEEPSSLGSRQHLQAWGMPTPPVPVDAGGVLVSEIHTRALLLTPAHQFPTGVILDGERRRALIQWATAGGLIIEDDYDAEHRYDRSPVPALRAMLTEHVCYAGSVSKLLAPALRLGWLLVPTAYRADFIGAKRIADLGNGLLSQLVLAHLMDSGELERHLRYLRPRHRRRRDAMINAIHTHLPKATVHGVAAGLHLMITFDAGIDDTELAAAALRHGVKLHPLSWHRQRPGPPGLVLGYAATTPSVIDDGMRVVGELLS